MPKLLTSIPLEIAKDRMRMNSLRTKMMDTTLFILRCTLLISVASSYRLDPSHRVGHSSSSYTSPLLSSSVPDSLWDTKLNSAHTDSLSNKRFKSIEPVTSSMHSVNELPSFSDSSSAYHRLPNSNIVQLEASSLPVYSLRTSSTLDQFQEYKTFVSEMASAISSTHVEWEHSHASVKTPEISDNGKSYLKDTEALTWNKQSNTEYHITPSSVFIPETSQVDTIPESGIPHIPLDLGITKSISENWNATPPFDESKSSVPNPSAMNSFHQMSSRELKVSNSILDSTVSTNADMNGLDSDSIHETSLVQIIHSSVRPSLTSTTSVTTKDYDAISTMIPTSSMERGFLFSNYRRKTELPLNDIPTSLIQATITGTEIQPTSHIPKEFHPTPTYTTESFSKDSSSQDLTFPDLPSASDTVTNSSSKTDEFLGHPGSLHPNTTQHSCAFDNFLHQFLLVEKRIKSARSSSKPLDNNILSQETQDQHNSQRTSSSFSSLFSTDTQNAGVVCYDDRTSISLPDIDCPKATSRKVSLSEHHLQQILKNEGGSLLHGVVTPSDVEEVDLNEIDRKKDLLTHLQQQLDKEISVYKSVRHQIMDYFIFSTNRDVLSLMNFLTDIIEKIFQEDGSDSRNHKQNNYDKYILCEIFQLDMKSFTSMQSQLEDKILKSESQFLPPANAEDIFEQIQFYNHYSRNLLQMKNKIVSAFSHLNETFENLIPKITSWASQRKFVAKEKDNLKNTDKQNVIAPPIYMSDNSNKSKLKRNDSNTSEQPNTKEAGHCKHLKEYFESNTKTKKVDNLHVEPKRDNLNSNAKSNDTPSDSLTIFGRYGTIVSELCHFISLKLAHSTFPGGNKNITLDDLDNLNTQSMSLREEFTSRKDNKRAKRNVAGFNTGSCLQQGARLPQSDFLNMCATCVRTTVLDTSFFPRHITEKVCLNDGSSSVTQSGSVGIPNGCLNEGGRPAGLCKQQYMTILLLRRNPGRCMKIVNRGQEFISDQWKLITYKLRIGCECVVDKNSQFAKYLTFG